MSQPDSVASALAAVPELPRDDEGPVFAEPWQAQAFSMTIRLYEKGIFTWPEWAATLADEITRAQNAGDPDIGDTYYLHWLAALERISSEKSLTNATDLNDRRDAWERATLATPHGEPIVLGRELAKKT